MPRVSHFPERLLPLVGAAVLACCAVVNGQLVNRAIGGISVDGHGVLRTALVAERQSLAEALRDAMQPVPSDLAAGTTMRMLSLTGLQEAVLGAAVDSTAALPDDVRYLAGLLSVEYVFIFPAEHDIVLAGPAEGWTTHGGGDVVGINTGQPVVCLDDLLIALRCVDRAREEGITCSIDPTPEGRQALNQYLRRQRRFHPAVSEGVEQALGQQQITLTGVPADSHFARVLVGSDYRMKRIGMNLEPAPIDGLPGFLDLLKQRPGGLNHLMPRWWIAANYDAVARSADGLAWQLRGRGVKVMTEDEIVSRDGSVAGTGKVNPIAQEWADTMTAKYDELSTAEPVFGQLKNLMDLAVVAALLTHHDLINQAGCDLSLLTRVDSPLQTERWEVPQTVATESSYIKRGREYLITASGGVEIDSWYTASQTATVPEISAVRSRAATGRTTSWRWNH